MKKVKVLAAVLVLLILAAPGASAETYVEGYLGNAFLVTSPNPLELNINPAYRGPAKTNLEFPRTISSGFMFGAKLGTWFSKEGFPRVNYPDWMKYVGFYLDGNFHGLDKSNLTFNTLGSRRMYVYPSNYPYFQHYKFWLSQDASIFTLSFMFAFRYGFFPREKIPFGKLQPYVAVGPAILITTIKPTFKLQPNNRFIPVPPSDGLDFDGSRTTTVSLGLAAELGVRYMITKFLSIDTSFKYRYARPYTSFGLNIYGVTHELVYAPQLNLFSLQVGVAYHF